MAAELAERDDREARRLGVGHPLPHRLVEAPRDRPVGQVGKRRGDLFERHRSGEVADGEGEGEAAALDAHPAHRVPLLALPASRGKRLSDVPRPKALGEIRKALELHPQEGRMRRGPIQSVVHLAFNMCFPHATGLFRSVGAAQHLQLPSPTHVNAMWRS